MYLRKTFSVTGAILCFGVVGLPTFAYAGDVPGEDIALSEPTASAGKDASSITIPAEGPAPLCTPNTKYSLYQNTPNHLARFDNETVYNQTSHSFGTDMHADFSGTVGLTVGISVTAGVKAGMLAKLEGTVNSSVTATMTAAYGVTIHPTVTAHTALIGDYGIHREYTKWRKTYTNGNCENTSSAFIVTAPYRKGWSVRETAL